MKPLIRKYKNVFLMIIMYLSILISCVGFHWAEKYAKQGYPNVSGALFALSTLGLVLTLVVFTHTRYFRYNSERDSDHTATTKGGMP